MSTRDEEDFSREIRAHLELEADRLIDDGVRPDEARNAALRAFGNVTLARERFHEGSRWLWVEQFLQDLRYGGRTLSHSPAFAATTILTLAIGLALTTGVFTVFNAYVLRSFAVRDPAGLYQVVWHARDAAGRNLRWRDYEAIRDRRDLFTDAIAESTRYVSSRAARSRRSSYRATISRRSVPTCCLAGRLVRETKPGTPSSSATRRGPGCSRATRPPSAARST